MQYNYTKKIITNILNYMIYTKYYGKKYEKKPRAIERCLRSAKPKSMEEISKMYYYNGKITLKTIFELICNTNITLERNKNG